MLTPVILSGGSGTRLWPLSRENQPKQLLARTGQHTMLQETIHRLDGLDADTRFKLNRSTHSSLRRSSISI